MKRRIKDKLPRKEEKLRNLNILKECLADICKYKLNKNSIKLEYVIKKYNNIKLPYNIKTLITNIDVEAYLILVKFNLFNLLDKQSIYDTLFKFGKLNNLIKEYSENII